MKISQETKSKTGRPREEINWEFFEFACRIMATQKEICEHLQISDSTLSRRVKEQYGHTFEDAYKKLSAHGKISLRRAQMALAKKGNPTMLIWLGKQYLGQTDKGKEAEHDWINEELEILTPEDKRYIDNRASKFIDVNRI